MIGERIGNYVITQMLGEGGMGQVYLAEHPQIGKKVALKVLHPELSENQEIVTRFFHEAKAVNDIGHPNIVDILDFGMCPSPRGQVVYLVMELLAGQTLTKSIEQGPIEPTRAARIAWQVADALVASHERGIVHRDLKPDNIMLIARGRDPEFVKLLDFGIAKLTGNQPTSTRTRTGMVIGTPTYMSPEQCEGKGATDHRTDIYALGVVLFEMLTGRVPFDGSGYGEILVKHLMEQPPPISSLKAGVPAHIEQLVMKALQKKAADRFANMREMANALDDPQRYVEANGGLGKFLPTPIHISAAANAATRVVAVPAATGHPATTLSQSVGEVGVPTAHLPPPTPKRGKGLFVALGAVTLVLAAGAILFVTRNSGTDVAQAASTQPTPTPAPTPTPTPAPTPTPTPAAQTKVKLSFETKPEGGSVFYGNETTERCKTPCSFEVERSDSDAIITIKLAGYGEENRTMSLKLDGTLSLALVKKHATPAVTPTTPRPTTKPTKPDGKHPVGDNTLNPFE